MPTDTRRQTLPLWQTVAIFLGLCLAACTNSAPEANSPKAPDKPQVVSTSTIIAHMAERVGGDAIRQKGILQPGADPHIYEPVPADSAAFEEADLILYNGYHLEPGLIKLMESAGAKARKFAVGEVVPPLEKQNQSQKVPDPHVWGDAKNGILMINAIRDALSELSPAEKEQFAKNAAQLVAELQRLDTWIQQQIATIPENQRRIVTTHDAFEYYARAYGLSVAGTLIGISTEEQPSAQTVKNLAEEIKKTRVPAIFAETTINPRLITTVAEEAGVKLAPQQLYADSIGAPGSEGDAYTKMLQANTRAIVEALGGKYTPLSAAEAPKEEK